MPQIKLDILEIGKVTTYADRSIDVDVVDRVRGPVVLRMQESEVRWLFASLADVVRPWQEVEDED
ncbi:hypothetical protein [Streptomyces chattanoogensis]|uniref:hypothetical protein n=1 Tax=Streptomyces chattanoogensis TaxID=66876 RepID=UPI00367E9814